ncbi:winged helix-turn-helix transcriptional regulator [Streptomyces sp. 110]|uniref:Winged helix-turn-helix transcriptional regulator n=1 Tax=Streptomyces endocoffeicus TaxID=2898945 RepID=A0ABS1Q632_9ACTN|nr:metalloregulator ArsR/SmtB family transcription factor [Streptomyces endocoffeicus]MBL1120138.1 winged helix-turn-helix transcriptional regulator [Streptomyces endocoffeicus]
MRIIGEERTRERRPAQDLSQVPVTTQASTSYDFLISLRAVYNTETWERSRRWAAGAREAMGTDLHAEGSFFFEGKETALGLGLLPLIPTLGSKADPTEFISLVAATPAEYCALLMLDTGETPVEAIDLYRSVLSRSTPIEPSGAERSAVEGFAGAFAERVFELLRDPAGCKQRLLTFLNAYLEKVFVPIAPAIEVAVCRAAESTEKILAMQPTLASIEALTGGYTLSSALKMDTIDLAPSVFIYPFMAQRMDQGHGRALIVFGVRDDATTGFQESNPEHLLDAMKALANPHRLQILRLLLERPALSGEFTRLLDLSQPTVHHHLAQLRSCGLIRQERVPEGMLYSFRPEAAELLVADLAQYFGLGSQAEIS